MFVVRSTAKTPEAVVEAIKAYAEGKKWQYLGANKILLPDPTDMAAELGAGGADRGGASMTLTITSLGGRAPPGRKTPQPS
jgi:hypothetical protein